MLGTRWGYLLLAPLNTSLRGLDNTIRKAKERLSLFAFYSIVYLENPQKPTEKFRIKRFQ